MGLLAKDVTIAIGDAGGSISFRTPPRPTGATLRFMVEISVWRFEYWLPSTVLSIRSTTLAVLACPAWGAGATLSAPWQVRASQHHEYWFTLEASFASSVFTRGMRMNDMTLDLTPRGAASGERSSTAIRPTVTP